MTNLVWTAKEAAAKIRREGLRLDVRHAVVAPADAGAATARIARCESTGPTAWLRRRAGGERAAVG